MSKELTKKGTQIEIAELVSRGKVSEPEDLVKRYKVTYAQAVMLLSSPNFIALVQAFSKARSHMSWHAKALPRIISMIDSLDPDISLRAIKLLAQITESVKGAHLDVNINLEAMVKQFAESNPQKKAGNDLHDEAIEAEYRKILNEE